MQKLPKYFFILFLFFSILSCKKDYVCVCTITEETEAIYYLNKIETNKTVKTDYSNSSLHATKKNATKECTNLNKSYSEENTELASGRSGGKINYQTTCTIN